MHTITKLSQRKHLMCARPLSRSLILFLILSLLLPASGVQAQTPLTVQSEGLTMVTVDTSTSNDMPTASTQTMPASMPLAQLLNSDGTLDLERGFDGNLDPAGWQMVSGQNGEPRFVRTGETGSTNSSTGRPMAVPGDENWDDKFGTPGPDSAVYAIAVSGSEVYVGGFFTTTGGVPANRIAKWDGTSWSALGSGMNQPIYAITVSGTGGVPPNDKAVYAGGDFTTAGGGPANYIAKWDGTSWSALGSGMNNDVDTIAVSGGNVYAGGNFTTAGGA